MLVKVLSIKEKGLSLRNEECSLKSKKTSLANTIYDTQLLHVLPIQ